MSVKVSYNNGTVKLKSYFYRDLMNKVDLYKENGFICFAVFKETRQTNYLIERERYIAKLSDPKNPSIEYIDMQRRKMYAMRQG